MSRHPEHSPRSVRIPARSHALYTALCTAPVRALVPALLLLIPLEAATQDSVPAPVAELAPAADLAQGAALALVASEVTVSAVEASLRLEFTTGETLTVSLANGRVVLDGSTVGPAPSGEGLDRAWRALLGRAITTETEALPALLLGWQPPGELPSDQAQAAELLVDRVATALDAIRIPSPRSGAVRIHVDETLTIGAMESVPLPLLLFRSRVRVEGRVEGDVVVAGGTLDLAPGARIEGNVRWSGAEILGDRTTVTGAIEEIPGLADLVAGIGSGDAATAVPSGAGDFGDQIRREVRAATREAITSSARGTGGRGSTSLGRIGDAFANLFRTLLSLAILLGAALALVHFFPQRAEVIAQTVRASSGRSVLVGVAGMILAFPLWIVGIVVLAISIIGIPFLVVWIPVMPLALATAILIGYLAAARALGGRLFQGEARRLAGLDLNEPVGQIGIGLAALLGAFALAGILGMGGPWFGVFQGVLLATGVVLSGLAASIGLGAVILSKVGQDTRFAGDGWDAMAGGDPDGLRAATAAAPAATSEGGAGADD